MKFFLPSYPYLLFCLIQFRQDIQYLEVYKVNGRKLYIAICLHKHMIVPIPKWVIIRYSALYREFKCRPFTREDAKKVLDNFEINSEEKMTNSFFSALNKSGWVEVSKDKENSRKKIFKLLNPNKIILELDIGEK